MPAATHLNQATAVTYSRTASRSRDDQAPLRAQQLRCCARARELDALVDREFFDPGQSGLVLDRPGLRALLAYVAAHPVRYVIVSDPDRLARSFKLHGQLLRQFAAHGCTVAVAGPSGSSPAALPMNFPLAAALRYSRSLNTEQSTASFGIAANLKNKAKTVLRTWREKL